MVNRIKSYPTLILDLIKRQESIEDTISRTSNPGKLHSLKKESAMLTNRVKFLINKYIALLDGTVTSVKFSTHDPRKNTTTETSTLFIGTEEEVRAYLNGITLMSNLQITILDINENQIRTQKTF